MTTVPPSPAGDDTAGPDAAAAAPLVDGRMLAADRGDGSSALRRPGALARRAFVAAALAAGAGAGAGAVTAALATDPGAAPAPPSEATVLRGRGIDPSGATDSTAGLQALVDAAPDGARLWLPAGLYLVDGIVLRRGQSLAGPAARTYVGRSPAGARLRARLADQVAPVLTVGEFGHVADIAVEGNGRRQPAVRPAGFGAVLERVTMLDASVGYDGNYTSGSVLRECQIHENTVGVQNIVDSVVQACTVNANRGDGIALGSGANDNMIVGTKLEWNDGHGLVASQAVHNVVLGGIVDRNGRTGARWVECAHTIVAGTIFRRNGRLAQDSPADDCHLAQENCTALVVTGIATNHGRDDDDASGYSSPAVAIRTEGGEDVTFTGNDLTGRTSDVAVASGAAGLRDTLLLNSGVRGVQSASGGRVRVGLAELTVAAGSSERAAFEIGGVPLGGAGSLFRLLLASRNAVTGARGAAEVLLLVARDGERADVRVGAVTNSIGNEFGEAAPHQVGAAVTADGGTLTVSIANGGDGPSGMRLELC